MKIVIRRNALLSALEASKHTFPDEFIGLFRGNKSARTVEANELIIPPLSIYGEDSASYSPWFLPPHMDFVASYHSHPTGPALPSRADLHLFGVSGTFHFIGRPPFTIESTNCFDQKGRKIEFKIK